MNYLSEFIAVATIHILAVMSPGPDLAIVTKNSLVYSRKSGVLSALGIGLGILVHITYSVIGVALILSKTPILLTIIKYIGATYLVYIGYLSLASKYHATKKTAVAQHTDLAPIQAVKMGFITNVTNPNATLFFLSIYTTLISAQTPVFVRALYGLEMSLATFAWFAVVALTFSLPIIKNRLAGAQFYIEKLMGVILILFALKIFFNW
jgi:RhtB (resistance to homoserine/threonine) family protein